VVVLDGLFEILAAPVAMVGVLTVFGVVLVGGSESIVSAEFAVREELSLGLSAVGLTSCAGIESAADSAADADKKT